MILGEAIYTFYRFFKFLSQNTERCKTTSFSGQMICRHCSMRKPWLRMSRYSRGTICSICYLFDTSTVTASVSILLSVIKLALVCYSKSLNLIFMITHCFCKFFTHLYHPGHYGQFLLWIL